MTIKPKILYPLYLNRGENSVYRLNTYACTYYHDPYNLPKNEYPIEKITHHFWLKTHKKTAADKELSEENLYSLLNQYSNLNYEQECSNIEYYLEEQGNFCSIQNYYDSPKFKHFFWVNDEILYPQTVKKLEAIGVEVKNIKSLSDKYEYIDQINEYIDKAYYGSMVDILKYATVFHHGGVAIDINFSLWTSKLENFLNAYSFIAMNKNDITTINSLENFFIAAHSHHTILSKNLDNVSKIFNDYGNLFCYGDCSDLNLTHITWSEWTGIVTGNIENNKNEVNEIFCPCLIDELLEIGVDGFAGQTWRTETIIAE